MSTNFLNTKAAARYLDVNVTMVGQYIREDKLPAIKVETAEGGKFGYLIAKEDLDKFKKVKAREDADKRAARVAGAAKAREAKAAKAAQAAGHSQVKVVKCDNLGNAITTSADSSPLFRTVESTVAALRQAYVEVNQKYLAEVENGKSIAHRHQFFEQLTAACLDLIEESNKTGSMQFLKERQNIKMILGWMDVKSRLDLKPKAPNGTNGEVGKSHELVLTAR